jgi:hypothetical protein
MSKASQSRWALILLMVVGMLTCGGMAQDVEDQPPEPQPKIPPSITEMQKPVYVPATPTFVGGMPVWLRLADEVKVKAHVGEQLPKKSKPLNGKDVFETHCDLAEETKP